MERFASNVVPRLVEAHGAIAWSLGRGRVARALNGSMSWRHAHALLFPTNPPFFWSPHQMHRTTFVVHDLTPLTAPALCQTRTVRSYTRFVPRCLEQGRVVAVSQRTAEDVADFFAVPVPPVIGNVVVAPPQERSGASPSDDAWAVTGGFLAVGTVEPRKRYDALLDAYLRYRAERSVPLPLTVVGRLGWARPETVRRLRETPGVQWHAHLGDRALWALYRSALCVVTASEHEGFNMPAFEAMSVGTVALVPSGSPPEEIGAIAPSLLRTYRPGGTALSDAMVEAEREISCDARVSRATTFPHAHYTAASVASRLGALVFPALHGVPMGRSAEPAFP
jgi:glycosyltransferase involved in cell wall biosynthesis